MKIMMISADSSLGKKNIIDDTSQFRDVVKSLAKELEEIHIICKSIYPIVSPWQEKNIFVHPIAKGNILKYIWNVLRFGRNILKVNKIDLITSQDVLQCGLPAYFLKRQYCTKVLMELHGDYLNNPQWYTQGWQYRLYNIFGKWLLRRGDFVRVTSLQIQKQMRLIGVPEKKMYYVPHRTDIQKFNPTLDSEPLRLKLNLQKKDVILFVGRFSKEKAMTNVIMTFVKTHRLLPNTHLILIGDGPDRLIVENLIQKYQLTSVVTHIPRVANKDMPPFYTLSRVLLLTSIFEGRPKVIQEALACGIPVVATNLSGITELVIDGKTGFLSPIGDIDALAQSLIKILTNPTLAKSMREHCRQHMENDFTWERGIAGMLETYRQAIAS